MVVGETLMLLSGGPYYSPQFNRGGNGAVFPFEVLQLAGGVGLAIVVEVEHKNSADTSWFTLATTTLTVPAVNFMITSGIMEQLRYKFTVQGADPTDAVHFNMLAPQWRPCFAQQKTNLPSDAIDLTSPIAAAVAWANFVVSNRPALNNFWSDAFACDVIARSTGESLDIQTGRSRMATDVGCCSSCAGPTGRNSEHAPFSECRSCAGDPAKADREARRINAGERAKYILRPHVTASPMS